MTTAHALVRAFAERFGVTRKIVMEIGTDQLCHCRSDEARRLLLFGIKPKRTPGRRTSGVEKVPFKRPIDVTSMSLVRHRDVA